MEDGRDQQRRKRGEEIDSETLEEIDSDTLDAIIDAFKAAEADARARSEARPSWAEQGRQPEEPSAYEMDRLQRLLSGYRYYSSILGDPMPWTIDLFVHRHYTMRIHMPGACMSEDEALEQCCDNWEEGISEIAGRGILEPVGHDA